MAELCHELALAISMGNFDMYAHMRSQDESPRPLPAHRRNASSSNEEDEGHESCIDGESVNSKQILELVNSAQPETAYSVCPLKVLFSLQYLTLHQGPLSPIQSAVQRTLETLENIFGENGFPNLQVVALGDFNARGKDEPPNMLFVRDPKTPWNCRKLKETDTAA